MPGVCGADLTVYRRRWRRRAAELRARVPVRYLLDDNRATGYLKTADFVDVLDDLERLSGVRYPILAFQAYRDGTAGTDWHADDPFDDQVIVSLGARRSIGFMRRDASAEWEYPFDEGDVLRMPSGFQDRWFHRIPPQPDVTEERVALVFRTAR